MDLRCARKTIVQFNLLVAMRFGVLLTLVLAAIPLASARWRCQCNNKDMTIKAAAGHCDPGHNKVCLKVDANIEDEKDGNRYVVTVTDPDDFAQSCGGGDKATCCDEADNDGQSPCNRDLAPGGPWSACPTCSLQGGCSGGNEAKCIGKGAALVGELCEMFCPENK